MGNEMRPSREDIINQLFENMDRFKRGMHTHTQSYLQSLPIPRSQLEVLFAIKHAQPISFKQLAERLYLTPGAVSQLVDGLCQHGLVTRETDPNDRRVHCLQLSKKGDKLLADIEKRRRDNIQNVISGLDTEELVVWLRVQEKLAAQFTRAQHKNEKEA